MRDVIAKTMRKAERGNNKIKAYMIQKQIVICISVTIFHILYDLIPELDLASIFIRMYMKHQKELFIFWKSNKRIRRVNDKLMPKQSQLKATRALQTLNNYKGRIAFLHQLMFKRYNFNCGSY